jgi:hypothetical protein
VEIIPAAISWHSTLTSPDCDFDDCRIKVLSPQTIAIHAADRFGNAISTGYKP